MPELRHPRGESRKLWVGAGGGGGVEFVQAGAKKKIEIRDCLDVF